MKLLSPDTYAPLAINLYRLRCSVGTDLAYEVPDTDVLAAVLTQVDHETTRRYVRASSVHVHRALTKFTPEVVGLFAQLAASYSLGSTDALAIPGPPPEPRTAAKPTRRRTKHPPVAQPGAADARDYLAAHASETLLEQFDLALAELPAGNEFEDVRWNLVELDKRVGNAKRQHLDFGQLRTREMIIVAKTYVLMCILRQRTGIERLRCALTALEAFEEALDGALPTAAVTGHADAAWDVLRDGVAPRTGETRRRELARVAEWLNVEFGTRARFYPPGRTVSGEPARRLPNNRVVASLLALNTRPLDERDRLFCAAFALLVATGLRIGELLTLPKNCLVRHERYIGIRFIPEKDTSFGARWVPVQLGAMVEDALRTITEMTESGRAIARALRASPQPDWHRILLDERATVYFLTRLVAVLQERGIAITVSRLETEIGMCLYNSEHRMHVARGLLARVARGERVTAPAKDGALELRCRKAHPVVKTAWGESVLSPEDALFVVPRNLLNHRHAEQVDNIQVVSGSMFKAWLTPRLTYNPN